MRRRMLAELLLRRAGLCGGLAELQQSEDVTELTILFVHPESWRLLLEEEQRRR